MAETVRSNSAATLNRSSAERSSTPAAFLVGMNFGCSAPEVDAANAHVDDVNAEWLRVAIELVAHLRHEILAAVAHRVVANVADSGLSYAT